VSITIEPLGGLGNQLFAYGLGRCLALKLDVALEADLSNFLNYEWHNYELDSFANAIDREFGGSMGRADRTLAVKRRRALSRLTRSKVWPDGRTLTEGSWRFDPAFLAARDGARLRGYFQSWKYFESCSDVLRREINDISEPTSWFVAMQEDLDALTDWTAVHVRRGNYVNLPNMGVVDDDYYARSVALVDALAGPAPLVVFSDDPEAVRRMPALTGRRDTRFIEPPPESRPIESMVLMSMGSHSVMANSTFSWWASWLAHREDRVVVCPRPWLDDADFDERDLILPSWVTIGRRSGGFVTG
jgi:hypothetical protein